MPEIQWTPEIVLEAKAPTTPDGYNDPTHVIARFDLKTLARRRRQVAFWLRRISRYHGWAELDCGISGCEYDFYDYYELSDFEGNTPDAEVKELLPEVFRTEAHRVKFGIDGEVYLLGLDRHTPHEFEVEITGGLLEKLDEIAPIPERKLLP